MSLTERPITTTVKIVSSLFNRPTKFVAVALTYMVTVCLCSGASKVDPADVDPRDSQWDLAIDPHQVLGAVSCEKCHANEVNIWKQTPHNTTYLTLHRKPEAQQIAKRLGIASFKTDANCIQCHYTMQQQNENLVAISGVSCESCHGAAQNWIAIHNDYGDSVTRESETKAHRRQRLAASIDAGMRNPVNVYLVAQSCYRCHTVPDERLVNVGGHSAGSLDFELVSWSQGTVRHRFLDSAGQTNGDASPERVRLLFVAGMIADLEHSLRATARATEKATFGVTSAQRASRAAKRLKAAQEKIANSTVEQILEVYANIKLRLNNEAELTAAADEIQKLGLRFAALTHGRDLAAIDEYVPAKSTWK